MGEDSYKRCHLDLISKIYKQLIHLNNKTTQSKNGQKNQIDISPENIYGWPVGTWKDVQHHWLLEKCKPKLQWGATSCWSEWPSLIFTNNKCWEGVKKREPSYTTGRNVNCKLVQSLLKPVWRFLRKLNLELAYDPAISLLGIYPDKTTTQQVGTPVCS